jgi:hypothetical protein
MQIQTFMKKFFITTVLLFSIGATFCQIPLYRYYNARLQKHYFTIDFNEYGNGANGWAFEGVSCQVYPPNFAAPDIAPVYRFFNSQTGDHYYTTGKFITRRDLRGYHFESVAFCVYRHPAPGLRPFLEYWNYGNGDHFYTVDKRELGRGFEGYEIDNTVGFVMPRQ